MKKIIPLALTTFFLVAQGMAADEKVVLEKGKAEHVVMIVWDGMRPDFVTEAYTPTLHKLMRSGVFFNNNHSAYITSTEVNGTVLATGVYPNRNHIIANREYRPAMDALKPVQMEDEQAVSKGGEDYIGVPTVEETLQSHGYRTVIAGTKGVALLPDRTLNRTSTSAKGSDVIYAGKSSTPGLSEKVTEITGALFPPKRAFPNSDADAWTTNALTDVLWKEGVPKFSLLWMSDPDYSQHDTAPGSPVALAALKSVDDNLAKVLTALEIKGVRDKTDIILVSDHGFSTIEKNTDVIEALNKAGFSASGRFIAPPKPGSIVVVGVGGSMLFYIIGSDAAITRKLVDFLQGSDFAGVIFTKEKLAGTFTLQEGRLDSPDAPDVVISFRWNNKPNAYGVPGCINSDGKKEGTGMHASLSKFDVHNTLIACGPDFRRGFVNELPTGNVDVAPTILWILGIKPSVRPDGRVLFEAITDAPAEKLSKENSTLREERNEGGIQWRQYLKISHLGPYTYFDEGNSEKVEP